MFDLILNWRIKRTIRKLMSELDNSKDASGFCHWAFGNDYQMCSHQKELMERWNQKHSTKFIIKPDGKFYDDLEKMISVWRLHVG